MTDKKTLKKIFEQAQKNGWRGHWCVEWNICDPKDDGLYFSDYLPLNMTIERYEWHFKTFKNRPVKLCCNFEIDTYGTVIFSHEFAKAFWTGIMVGNISEWKYRLREMVLEKDPIKYLERFL